MKVIDNINVLLKDELINTIKSGSKISIAASCFSMYAYKELKSNLRVLKNFGLSLHLLPS